MRPEAFFSSSTVDLESLCFLFALTKKIPLAPRVDKGWKYCQDKGHKDVNKDEGNGCGGRRNSNKHWDKD